MDVVMKVSGPLDCEILSITATLVTGLTFGNSMHGNTVPASITGGFAVGSPLFAIRAAMNEVTEVAKPQTPCASPPASKDISPTQQHG
jgi:hypothetical protein